jgi:hypothetical protein
VWVRKKKVVSELKSAARMNGVEDQGWINGKYAATYATAELELNSAIGDNRTTLR